MKRLILSLISICLLSCTSEQPKKPKKKTNPLIGRAYSYLENDQIDSAFTYFLKAKDLATLQKDSLDIGYCLSILARISVDKRDYLTGQKFSLEAQSYLNEKKEKHHLFISENYHNLGIATHNLRDYKKAIEFYDAAIKFSTTVRDINQYLNNKAYLYQETKQYKKALDIYQLILRIGIKDKRAHARTLSNISFTKWLLDSNYNVLPELLAALHIREKEGNLLDQNSSYSYLADYYAKHNTDSALYYANRMYAGAKKLKSSDDQLYALQKLIKLSPVPLNNHYFETYLKLDDSAQIIRNKAKNQFALIRYETEKHKANNLLLQKDNTEKKYQIIKRELLLYVAILVLISATIIGFIWYKKRKQRLELEAQNTIRENQLKTSKKVHDVVANGLYRVMTEIENREDIDKEHILDKIDDMYQKSRDISYDQAPVPQPLFHEKLAKLCQTFTTANTTINCVGNNISLWKNVTAPVQHEVEHILQELLVNMDKHSQATEVLFQFAEKEQQIHITYSDNGIGLPQGLVFKNGLSNTGNRIRHINGSLTFDTETEKGLQIQIAFPIA